MHTGYIIPQGWHVSVEVHPLRRDPLEGDLTGWRRMVDRSPIPPLHMVASFSVDLRVRP